MSKKLKEFTNGEITVIWDSSKCFHVANCVRLLPEVYKPGERPWPWIQVEIGSTEALMAQIKQCPSGAITYFMN
jgi:uncharacterized Fe-S cluster protein YjdI